MKTRKYIHMAVAAILIGMASCSDDILDKKPLDSYNDLDVFGDEVLLKSFVNGIYQNVHYPFSHDDSFTDALTDNSFNRHGSGSGDTYVRPYLQGQVNADNGENTTYGLWADAYNDIRRANLFFEQTALRAEELDQAALLQLTGEVRFLRAYLYFDLFRWYGSVPLITKTYGINDESYAVPKSTPNDIAAFIVAECDKAMTELVSISSGDYQKGRASVEAAMALKARTLLYVASPLFNSFDRARWEAARDANKAVMDIAKVTLVSGGDQYMAMFKGDNEQEVIMGRYFSANNRHVGNGLGYVLYPTSENGWGITVPTQDLVDSYELTNGLLPSDPASGYDSQNPYVDRDPRFYASILYNGAEFRGSTYDYFDGGKDSQTGAAAKHNSSVTGYNYRKWAMEDERVDEANTNPWYLFRKSEFYLNYAEAQIALGNDAEARTAINAIRGKYGMPDVTESGAPLQERYMRERRVELLMEDHHFFDIRRWQTAPAALSKPAMGVSVQKVGNAFQYSVVKVTEKSEQRVWLDKMYFLPIPTSEINKSGGVLVQDPRY